MTKPILPPRSALQAELDALLASQPGLGRTDARRSLAARYGVTLNAVDMRLYRPEVHPRPAITEGRLDTVLAAILAYQDTTGYPPSLRALAERLGVTQGTARTLVLALDARGDIEYRRRGQERAGIWPKSASARGETPGAQHVQP